MEAVEFTAGGFRIVKQFPNNFALLGPEGVVWDTPHCGHQSLETQRSRLQRAFEMGRLYERGQAQPAAASVENADGSAI